MVPGRLSARQAQGHAWERAAREYLERERLTCIEQNYRCAGGEIDLIMRDGATLVFVEVRQRSQRQFGGASASITPAKQRRLVHAAQLYLTRFSQLPACRFDVIAIDGEQIEWLRNVIEM